MLCSPIINNVLVTRTLIDGRAGLNVLSIIQQSPSTLQSASANQAFLRSHRRLHGPDWAGPLPVTFGARDNYRTELIDFDVAHIRLPYNAILGYPSLAKFMVVGFWVPADP